MKDTLFLRAGTIGLSRREGRKPTTLLAAARHNQRRILAERRNGHIDNSRTQLNIHLAGAVTPEEVVALARSTLSSAGVAVSKLRKDYVQAVELIFRESLNN